MLMRVGLSRGVVVLSLSFYLSMRLLPRDASFLYPLLGSLRQIFIGPLFVQRKQQQLQQKRSRHVTSFLVRIPLEPWGQSSLTKDFPTIVDNSCETTSDGAV